MQRFSNNARTTLTVEITELATEITVNSSDDFAVLLAGEYELATIAIGDAVEIVRVTARDGNTWTVERAQEGTTAAAWPAGTTVEARVTAGSLDGMMQASSVPDLVALDHGGNARGAEAINLQSGRGSADRVASGEFAVAIGHHNKASGPYSVAIGWGSQATAHGAAALSPGATASGYKSICAGDDGAVASGAYAAALGRSAQATAPSAMAIGETASATGNGSSAIGSYSTASAWSAFAAGGGRAAGEGSAAIRRGLAYGRNAIAIGPSAATSPFETVLSGFQAIQRDDWYDQSESLAAGAQAAFCTPYVDLGNPPAWTAATGYDNGDIVQPTTGGTVQYRAWTNWPIETGIRETATSTATEPTWPGAGDSVDIDADGDHRWIGIDWSAGYQTMEIPDGLAFFPTELAFICHEHSTLTGTPNVSIGTAATPGLLVDADDVTITGAPQIFRFTLANPNAGIPSGTAIQIKVNTPASAGRCVGRFMLSGYFVENPTNAV